MNTKFLLIIGAGCTLSEALNRAKSKYPPLDKGFFKDVSSYNEFESVDKYLRNSYDIDLKKEPDKDSLEAVMAILYTDIHNPAFTKDAITAFRSLIRLFNRRIADTTNNLKPTNRFNLYRILANEIDSGTSPNDITIITFNQDIQIEKVLDRLQSTGRSKKYGRIYNFPFCYKIPDCERLLSNPRISDSFESGDISEKGVRLLKLHGSLNWYSVHNRRKLSKKAILSVKKDFHITPRKEISSSLTYRRKFTFPLVIPPVTHKAGILHNQIIPLWSEADTALKNAEKILVYGYSCPRMDFESANLIRRTVHANRNLEDFSVVDPNPAVFQRYVELTNLDKLHYYKNAESYINQ